MNQDKLLNELIVSAKLAKTHYDIWWAQFSEAKPNYVKVMNKHSDFFLASQDAHYTSFFI